MVEECLPQAGARYAHEQKLGSIAAQFADHVGKHQGNGVDADQLRFGRTHGL